MISGIADSQYPSCLTSQFSRSNGPKEAAEQLQTQSSDPIHISGQARERHAAETECPAGLSDEKDLTPENKQEVEKLKKRDQEVKAHERAHMSAGADVVRGGASYEYQRGPDGKMYAVGGEVKIDTSKEKDSQSTVRKMQKIKRAAMAPAQPSATDRNVAAKASQMEAEARIELSRENAKSEDQEQEEKGSMPPGHIPTSNATGYNPSPQRNPSFHVTV